ncbi:MAG: hypothetical protein WC777_02335 [Candidatus Gracilibacteria bacterium]|jgi:hypothetical protein
MRPIADFLKLEEEAGLLLSQTRRALREKPPLGIPTVEDFGLRSLVAIDPRDLRPGNVILVGTVEERDVQTQVGFAFHVLRTDVYTGSPIKGDLDVEVECLRLGPLMNLLEYCPDGIAYIQDPLISVGRCAHFSNRNNTPATATVRALYCVRSVESFGSTYPHLNRLLVG